MSLRKTSSLGKGGSRPLGKSVKCLSSYTNGLRSSSRISFNRQQLNLGAKPLSVHDKPKGKGFHFEQEVADLYNQYSPSGTARRQRGSGAQWFRPGDVLTPEFLIECKNWSNPVVLKSWLEEAESDALAYSRIPILALNLRGVVWAIVRQTEFPLELEVPEPCLDIKGARTQATVPAGNYRSFTLRFEGHGTSYIGVHADLLFSSSHLFVL